MKFGDDYASFSPEIQAALLSALVSVWEDKTRNLEHCLYMALDDKATWKDSLEELRDTHNRYKFILTPQGKKAVERTPEETPKNCLLLFLEDPTNGACPLINGEIHFSEELGVHLSNILSGVPSTYLRQTRRDSIKRIKGAQRERTEFKIFRCDERHQTLFQRLEAFSPFLIGDKTEAQRLIRNEEAALLSTEKENNTREEWNVYRAAQWNLSDTKKQLLASSGQRLGTTWKLQPAGRLQEEGFGAYRLSEKRTNLRRSLLRDVNGHDLQAFDCSSSGWLLASILLGDKATYDVVQTSLNDTATDFALSHGFILHNEDKRGRNVIKKLMMTYLYGSKPHRQYLEASWDNSLKGVWRDQEAPAEFLASFGGEFPTFTTWMEHCKALAKAGTWTWPELYSGQILDAYRPQTETCEVILRRKGVSGVQRQRISQLPAEGIVPDERKMTSALAPIIIHSCDATVLKLTLEYLMDRASVTSVISPIHDCCVVSSDLGPHVQDAWNYGLRVWFDRLPKLQEALGLPDTSSNFNREELTVKLSREY